MVEHRLPKLIARYITKDRKSLKRLVSKGYKTFFNLLFGSMNRLADLPPSLPASLLVRLMQSIRRLGTLSYQSERILLRSLLGQLELTAAVAEKMGAEIKLPVSGVLQLMANYVGFVPPFENVALSGDKVRLH